MLSMRECTTALSFTGTLSKEINSLDLIPQNTLKSKASSSMRPDRRCHLVKQSNSLVKRPSKF